jgi:hypothetical protein
LEHDVPTLALHGINGESAMNYHLIDEESNEGRGFRREVPAHRQEIHPRKRILPRITSFFTRIQAGKIKIRRSSFERLQFQDQQLQILYSILTIPTLKKLNTKTSLKLK